MTMRIESFTGPYRFLSNFWQSSIHYEDILYWHVEGAFQAAKTTDVKAKKRIAAMTNPADAKAEGRKVDMREDWQEAKLGVMEDCLRRKFHIAGDLATKLLATGDAELIEGNHWNDTYWGVCRGVGENHLGKLLMKIREELKCENSSLE